MEFKTLGTLVDRKIGYGIVQPGQSVKNGVPVIKVNNIISGLYDINDLDTTTQENDAQYSRTRLNGGEVILSVVGTIGKTAIVPNQFAGCNLVRATALIDIKTPWLAQWVKYYIDSKQGQIYITQNLNTTVQPTLNIKSLVEMPIPFYDESYMMKATGILSELDSKIELNKKINNNLLEQAQVIFKREFLDIDELPVGWSKSNLTSIANYLNGLAMQKYRPSDTEIGVPVLKIKELRQGFCDSDSELCSPSIKSDYVIADGDVIFSWSGSLLVDFWCGGKCGLNQHLFKVTSDAYDPWFYFAWTNYHLAEFAHIAASKATTMGHIKRNDLEKAIVVIPSQEDYARIGELLSPIYKSIVANRLENNKLTQLRDALLPQLMSGELDVSNIEI